MSRNPDKAWGPLASSRNPTPARPSRPQASGTLEQGYRPAPAAPQGSGATDQANRYAEFLAAQAAPAIVGPSTSKTAKKYRGYDTQSQLWSAIEGAGLVNRDNAFQYAGQLATEADALGGQIGNEASAAMEEARAAHEARQREFLQGNNAYGAALAHNAQVADDPMTDIRERYYGDLNFDQARTLSEIPRAAQEEDARRARAGGGSGLPYIAPLGADNTVFDAAAQISETYNPGFGAALGLDTGIGTMPQALAQKYAESQLDRRRALPALPERPTGEIAPRMDVITQAADAGLEAPREDRAVARDLEATPLSQYTQRAAVGQFGIDPYLAAGQFDQQMDVADFRTNRDLQAIQETGMTYSEATAFANAQAEKQARAEEAAAGDENRQMEEAIVQQVSSIVGMDADSLASAADIDVATLGSIVADPGFQQTQADLGAIVSSGDATQLAEALASVARIDMTAYRVLEQLYAPYLPGGYNPMDEGTWYGG